MIITSFLMGGLGNQMFQIAKATSEGLDQGIDVKFNPKSFVPMEGNQPTNYLNNIFRNVKFEDIKVQLTRISETSWSYNKIEPLYYNSVEYYGYFQSSKNFEKNKNKIKEIFQPTNEFKEKIKNLYPSILKKNTVSVHVRMGDYFKISNILPIIDKTYIDHCINSIDNKSEIFIFSNDKEWVKKNLNYKNSTIVYGLEDYEELWMISMCNHNIMSNSSFSWWGSFLNEHDDKQIFAPSIWFGPNGEKNYQDIYEENWKKINVIYKNGYLIHEKN